MKLLISNIAWDIDEEKEIIDILKNHHIGGIEIAPTKIWDSPINCSAEEIADYRLKWENYGIKISAMQSLLYGKPELTLFAEEEARSRLMEYLEKVIKLAGTLGVKTLVFGSPKNRLAGELNKKEQMDIATLFFYEIGKVAIENNVVFCIEPNPPQYGCDFITDTQQGIEIVKQVNHPGFRLHLDTAAMSLNQEDYRLSIEKSLPYLSHFHISEPYLNLVDSNKNVGHQLISKVLKDVQYEHDISIEMKSGLLSSNVESVTRALDFVQDLYF